MLTSSFYRERSLFWHVSASRLRNVVCLNLEFLIEKIMSPVIFDLNHSFKRWNALCLTKKLFIKVSMEHYSRLVIFFFKEKFRASHASASRLRDCLLCRNNYISSCFWHRSFIQTVNCSSRNQITVCIARCSRLVAFYFQKKFFVLHSEASHLREVYF